jgi:uncharacterized protein (DUF1786 family)
LSPAPPASRLLALDVGTGTIDVLLYEPGRRPENSVKLVVPSRTMVAADEIRTATRRGRPVVFAGPVMGGGPVTRAMLAHRDAGLAFSATADAAATFADDLAWSLERGVRLCADDEVPALVHTGAVLARSGDLDLPGLLGALASFGVPTTFSGTCLAAQDHGFDPAGSNRINRFQAWQRALAERRPLEELFCALDEVPAALTRQRAAAAPLADLPLMAADDDGRAAPRPVAREGAAARVAAAAGDAAATTGDAAATTGGPPVTTGDAAATTGGPPVTVGDTGAAALLGALGDERGDAVLVNVGNGHTVCAVALEGRLAGVYEDHSNRLDAALLETNVRRFLAGDLPSDEVREAGGHGAALGCPVPAGLPILVTGPRRDLLAASSLPVRFPAPFGDMMMAGPVGLVRAHRYRCGV